jgi:hypothetical protein
MRSPSCHSERSEAALFAVLSVAKELVAPRPFTSFRAAAGGRLRGAITDVARQGVKIHRFAEILRSADSGQDDSNKRQDSSLSAGAFACTCYSYL